MAHPVIAAKSTRALTFLRSRVLRRLADEMGDRGGLTRKGELLREFYHEILAEQRSRPDCPANVRL